MKPFVLVVILLILSSGAFLFFRNQPSGAPSATPNTQEQTNNMQYVFEDPQKSPHHESNTPAHGSVLAGVPINIVIDFNFDLLKSSSIKIEMGSKDFGIGETVIDANKLSMRRKMDSNSPDGLYEVEYSACWPDGSCHQGFFQFAIDRSLREGFLDQTDKKEVEIKMSQLMFDPQNIRVSKGTEVTWINDDNVEHYVNTDSHPAHTYYEDQNSKALKKGESYSVTLDNPGIYPYHCSAHAGSMTGSILVE